nr:hypothetical protein [Kibdelosporangium sp. MJ126-NF4]
MYLVEVQAGSAEPGDRNTIAGSPILPPDQPWPECTCGERMMLFFQLDIPGDIPSFGGDHLLVFQCPAHNEDIVDQGEYTRQLPERFWADPEMVHPPGHASWRILICRTGEPTADADRHLVSHRLTVRRDEEQIHHRRDGSVAGRREFKIGGVPSWIQEAERFRCCCGIEMEYLCELEENFDFARIPGTDGDDPVLLLLGNEVYILACPAHCDPAAAWPVLHN